MFQSVCSDRLQENAGLWEMLLLNTAGGFAQRLDAGGLVRFSMQVGNGKTGRDPWSGGSRVCAHCVATEKMMRSQQNKASHIKDHQIDRQAAQLITPINTWASPDASEGPSRSSSINTVPQDIGFYNRDIW